MPGHADHVLYDLLIGPAGGKLRFARVTGAIAVTAARGVAVEDVGCPEPDVRVGGVRVQPGARSRAWTQEHKRVTFAQTCRMLTAWKNDPDTAWLYQVPNVALQQGLQHLQNAYVNF